MLQKGNDACRSLRLLCVQIVHSWARKRKHNPNAQRVRRKENGGWRTCFTGMKRTRPSDKNRQASKRASAHEEYVGEILPGADTWREVCQNGSASQLAPGRSLKPKSLHALLLHRPSRASLKRHPPCLNAHPISTPTTHSTSHAWQLLNHLPGMLLQKRFCSKHCLIFGKPLK